MPSGSGGGGAALGRASGGREAAGPPVPGRGSVPGEDLRRLEGPGSQMTNVRCGCGRHRASVLGSRPHPVLI